MVVNTKNLNTVAGDILRAVDSSELNSMSTFLEIEAQDGMVTLSVANGEYFVSIKIAATGVEEFHATVNASILLKLITQTTTEDIAFECKDNYLQVIGNGSYKIPLIFEGEEVATLSRLNIYNPTCEMPIERDVLTSIAKYNSKELSKGFISKPVQRCYYVDEKGCITFTTGACVNRFNLPQPVRFLLNNRIVNLFRLFRDDDVVNFTLGYDQLNNSIIQTKVRFETATTSLTAILQCDDGIINSVPVANIRSMSETVYPYAATIGKDLLLQAIGRLQLFNKNVKGSGGIAKCTFTGDKLYLSSVREDVVESVDYVEECPALQDDSYSTALDLDDLKATLMNCDEGQLTFKFGTGRALIIARAHIINIIPQCIT